MNNYSASTGLFDSSAVDAMNRSNNVAAASNLTTLAFTVALLAAPLLALLWKQKAGTTPASGEPIFNRPKPRSSTRPRPLALDDEPAVEPAKPLRPPEDPFFG
jgi:hypothetical protein